MIKYYSTLILISALLGCSATTPTIKPVEQSQYYTIGEDSVSYKGQQILNADPKTFKEYRFGYAKDNTHVYHKGFALPDSDPKSWEQLNFNFSKDSKHVYFEKNILHHLNASTTRFESFKGKDIKFNKFLTDGEHCYFYLSRIDCSTLRSINTKAQFDELFDTNIKRLNDMITAKEMERIAHQQIDASPALKPGDILYFAKHFYPNRVHETVKLHSHTDNEAIFYVYSAEQLGHEKVKLNEKYQLIEPNAKNTSLFYRSLESSLCTRVNRKCAFKGLTEDQSQPKQVISQTRSPIPLDDTLTSSALIASPEGVRLESIILDKQNLPLYFNTSSTMKDKFKGGSTIIIRLPPESI